jgi:hypothetical protein
MADNNKFIVKECFPKEVNRILLLDVLNFLKLMFGKFNEKGFNPLEQWKLHWKSIKSEFDNIDLNYPILIRGGGAGVSKLIKLRTEYENKEDSDLYYHFASQIIRLCCGVPKKGQPSCMALTLRKFRQLVYNIVMLSIHYQNNAKYGNEIKPEIRDEMTIVLYNIFDYTKNMYISDISVSSLVFVAIHKIK